MTTKEIFLNLNSYEEFDANREKFKGLIMDIEIREHMRKISPVAYAPSDVHREVKLKEGG